jgi:hypothetical protein
VISWETEYLLTDDDMLQGIGTRAHQLIHPIKQVHLFMYQLALGSLKLGKLLAVLSVAV